MFTFLTIVLVIALVVGSKTLVVIPMREQCVVERLGKFRIILNPGIHFLIPFFDNISYRHEIREQVMDIPSQSCISKDNIQIEVDGLVYLKVVDAYKASYGIGNYKLAATNLAQTTMRSEVGKLTLGEMFSEREALNDKIVLEIDKASDDWGIKVLRYEIMNIKPSAHVIKTLEQQMEAERDKRAEITLAVAEKESRINLSTGEKIQAINLSEGAKQQRINEANGRAQAITIVADATAQGLAEIATSITEPGGALAVKMHLIDKYISELGEILERSDVSVLPNEMANIKGIFEGVDQVTGVLKGKGV